MSQIKDVKARQILDSRGNPTLEVDLMLEGGGFGRFAVPSGASTGEREALELRDDDASRYLGKGVLKAKAHVDGEIRVALVGQQFESQEGLDKKLVELDGTKTKSRLGANAILGVSMAFAKACAAQKGVSFFQHLGAGESNLLPTPMMNILNGGAHADNGICIQEFMIIPAAAPSFAEALRMGTEIFHALKETLANKGLSTSVGDEGGFAPEFETNQEALDCIVEAINKAGYQPGKEVLLALDVAASEIYDKIEEKYEIEKNIWLSSEELCSYYEKLCSAYPIVSIEDPFDENDWGAFKRLTQMLGNHIQIVGDDLFVTDPKNLKKGIEEKSANAILIKLNQIGTLTETKQAVQMAQASGFGVIVSHRSGETEDVSIADLAVGFSAGQIKTGSLCRSDRVGKYNALLRIEEELASQARYAGAQTIKGQEK